MIYAVILGSLTVTTLAFQSVRTVMRIVDMNKLSKNQQRLFDKYDKSMILSYFFIELFAVLMILIASAFKAAFISTLLVEVVLFLDFVILADIMNLFGNVFGYSITKIIRFSYLLMSLYLLFERIPSFKTLFSMFASGAYMFNVLLLIVSFVIATLLSLVIINLTNKVLSDKDEYKNGTYKVTRKSFLRKTFLSEKKIKKLFAR